MHALFLPKERAFQLKPENKFIPHQLTGNCAVRVILSQNFVNSVDCSFRSVCGFYNPSAYIIRGFMTPLRH